MSPPTLRAAEERSRDDPERLPPCRTDASCWTALRRKYGETLADVMAFADEARQPVAELESYETAGRRARDAVAEQAMSALAAAEARARAKAAGGRAPRLGAGGRRAAP